MIRSVPIDEKHAKQIERLGMELMREDEFEDATMLLSLALAWRFAPVVQFNCNVDESAGQAEVISLRKPW